MGLTSGTKLGPYEVLSALGAGGMGEVYRARDTRLDRSVAIKILPSHLSSNPDLKVRLEREARAISSLQHPHICVLHDIGHQDGIDYLVMEFLEGETLAERLRRGALPVEQMIKIGIEIADALDKAHRRGIVHRDLKPGNIMLTSGGAKLMDFGLAKPSGPSAPASTNTDDLFTLSSPTSPLAVLTGGTPLTVAGTIVGTFQYMAPEQVEGKEADARSDIFAFGAVLYEMLTGKRAFEGKSQISVASAILEKDPEPISAVRQRISPALEHIILRALVKDPAKRWQSAGDMCAELEWVASSGATLSTSAGSVSGTPWEPRGRWFLGMAAVVAVLALLALAIGLTRKPPAGTRLVASIPPPEDAPFQLIGDVGAPPVLSPDGMNLVFGASDRIWIRSLESGEAHPLEGTENGTFPFWSPDSRRIAFFSAGKLRVMDIAGGAPMPLCDSSNPRGGSWSSKGVLLFTPNIRDGLYQIPATGGTPVAVTKLDTSKHSTHRWPQFLPDGDHFLYLAMNHAGQREFSGIYFSSLSEAGSPGQLLIRTDANALYESGYLLFLRKSDLMAQHFDVGRRELQSDPVRVAEKVLNDQGIWRGAFSVSNNGILTYASGVNSADEGQLTWFDVNGKVLGTLGERGNNDPRISPDGHKVALVKYGGPNPEVSVFDTANGLRTRLSTEAAGTTPVWSPDGKNIVYMVIPANTSKARLAMRAADGSGEDHLLYQEDQWQTPSDWSPDGKYILYNRGEPGASHIWVMPVAKGGKPFPFVSTNDWERDAVFSPDGHWVAYTSRQSGRDEVYVAPFPGGGQRSQISSSGAGTPRWRHDGKALYAVNSVNEEDILAFPINTEHGTIQTGEPKILFRTTVGQTLLYSAGYDVAPDGRLLINTLGQSRAGSHPLTLVANWPTAITH